VINIKSVHEARSEKHQIKKFVKLVITKNKKRQTGSSETYVTEQSTDCHIGWMVQLACCSWRA